MLLHSSEPIKSKTGRTVVSLVSQRIDGDYYVVLTHCGSDLIVA